MKTSTSFSVRGVQDLFGHQWAVRGIAIVLLLLSATPVTQAQLAGYTYEQEITIDHHQVSGTSDLTNFPLLLTVSKDYLRSTGNGGDVTSTSGYDIAFSDGTTQLDHEITAYNAATGEYTAWVRIPTLYCDQYTFIYMSYGNSSVTTDPSSTNTWMADYDGVWHLEEKTAGTGTADLYQDASGNGYHGDDGVSATGTDGVVGNGQEFDGTNDYIGMGDVLSHGKNDAMTYSAWIKTTATQQSIAGKSDHVTDRGVWFYQEGDNLSAWICDNGDCKYRWSNEAFDDGEWHHVAFTYDGSNSAAGIVLYGDGEVLTTFDVANPAIGTVTNSHAFSIGAANNSGEFFDGFIDEMRFSIATRSADWIKTEYNNQSNPGTFAVVGAGPSGPGGVGATDGTGNLALWLDASTISQSGTEVTSWSDLSGYGNDATSVAGTGPELQENQLNSIYPEVHFDVANTEWMRVADDASLNPDQISVFTVASYTSSTHFWGAIIQKTNNQGGGTEEGGGWGIVRRQTLDQIRGFVNNRNANAPGGGVNGTLAYNTPTIFSMVFDETENEMFYNETSQGTRSYTSPITDVATFVYLGYDEENAMYLDGDIAETIVINRAVNDAERIIINNYLSAKYAIALTDNDVYNEDNLGFDHEVAGIGRVDASNVHDDAQGSSIVRILNPSGLGDNEFMMWGHDNGLMSISTSDVPTGVEAKIGRTWAVSEVLLTTGASRNVGSVDIRFDLTDMGTVNPTDLRLVVDTDGDGVFADDATAVGSATHVTGNIYQFTGVTALTDNDRFTLGTADYSATPLEVSPGNVPLGLTAWFRADQGLKNGGVEVTSGAVDTWENSTPNDDFPEMTIGTGAPMLSSNGISYNAAVYFDGVDDKFQRDNVTGGTLFSDQDNTIIAVFQRKAHAGTDVYGGWRSAGDTRRMGYLEGSSNGSIRTDVWTENFRGTIDQTDNNVIVTVQTDATESRIIINGLEEETLVPTMDAISALNGDFALGCNGGTGAYVETYFGEYITFESAITADEINRIQSSLAMKYSITLDPGNGDYYASDGTKIWDATVGPAYQNQIVAIGRDDNTGLYLKQSRVDDDSLTIYIDALAADNQSNTGTINANRSFIMIGHNTLRLNASGTVLDMPSGITSRFDREWKITNHNFNDTYSIEFEWEELGPFDINDVRLLVDDDGDFSNATVLGTADGLTFTVGSIIVGGITTSHIPQNQTSYITLGSVSLGTTLPVELVEFRAEAQESDHTVHLNWSTSVEIDNDYFTIEKSADAEEWFEVLRLPGAGTSSQRIDYSSVDTDPFYGLSYYRLKQTDFDGSYSYSYTVPVNLGELQTEQPSLFPNPANDVLLVNGVLLDVHTTHIYNILGQDVSDKVKLRNGDSPGQYKLDISRLAPGVYSIIADGHSLKFMKQQ